MDELCWINGTVTPLSDAKVSVNDRGFVFADGVYEVLRVYDGEVFAMALHLDRLQRSCDGIALSLRQSRDDIAGTIESLVAQSHLIDGIVYLQATRGVGKREHAFPKDACPTLMIYTRAMAFHPLARQRAISVKDERWQKCWIKSIALLPNVLAKHQAAMAGVDEAIFIDGEFVREGSTTNVMMIRQNALITPPTGAKVLAGVTRTILLQLASEMSLNVQERDVTLDEAYLADEAFLTSTTRELAWISQWDHRAIGSGECGPWTKKLFDAFGQYRNQSRSSAHESPLF